MHPFRAGSTKTSLAIVIVLGSALLLVSVLILPQLLAPPISPAALKDIQDPRVRIEAQNERLSLANDVRGTMLQGLGGAVLLLSVYFTWRQLQVNKEGQITDRFTAAVNQLAHKELDVRLGGIYALERLANESPTDRAAIREILSAYVSTKSPKDPDEEIDWEFETNYTEDGSRPPLSQAMPAYPALRTKKPDVQAAIAVVGRCPLPIGKPKPLQLSLVDLRKADSLEDGHLEQANLAWSLLAGAALSGAQLQGANLTLALLVEADLRKANLAGARLDFAFMDGVRLEHADCRGANFFNAHLVFAFFDGADLKDANMEEANIIAARLANAKNLDSVKLAGARAGPDTTWPIGFNPLAAGVIMPDPTKGEEQPLPSPE
jgi:hypothetical protein